MYLPLLLLPLLCCWKRWIFSSFVSSIWRAEESVNLHFRRVASEAASGVSAVRTLSLGRRHSWQRGVNSAKTTQRGEVSFNFNVWALIGTRLSTLLKLWLQLIRPRLYSAEMMKCAPKTSILISFMVQHWKIKTFYSVVTVLFLVRFFEVEMDLMKKTFNGDFNLFVQQECLQFMIDVNDLFFHINPFYPRKYQKKYAHI